MNERPETTPHHLRHAARALFATHGYDGTSIREITAAAGANLGAVTYHFGSKQELYNQVVAEAVEPLAAAVTSAISSQADVMARIAALVRAYFEQISADEDTGRVMVQAMVIGKQPPPVAIAGIRTIHAALVGLVTEGQHAGVIRDGDPRLLGLSIVSVPLRLALVRRVLKANAGIDLDNDDEREAAIQHAIRFVSEALARHTGNP